ncbi:MAG: MBOAT family O-acyltransferase, partial [Verrucomicrobiota bacterium]
FALYVSFFPQLVAGPIERPQNLLPQIQKKRSMSLERWCRGWELILLGLVKKVAIADAVAPYVNDIFANPATYSSWSVLFGAYLFGLQIYGDFSGYTDMARGVARLLGFELMVNFKQPYFSQNVREFWQRWHISLSRWLRDYLYIPLGGNRSSVLGTCRNLMLVMLLGGLWHGAGWNFIIWGALHGIYLVFYFLYSQRTRKSCPGKAGWVVQICNIFLTFHLVTLTWIFFRATYFSGAMDYFRQIFAGVTDGKHSLEIAQVTLFYFALVLIIDLPMYRKKREYLLDAKAPPLLNAAIIAGLVLLLSFVGQQDVHDFIYFQF